MSRARGFADWRPQTKTRVLLGQVNAVLAEYRAYLPLTCRQIFYRLVGAHGYPKTEHAYDRLQEMLVLARRSGRVPFEDLRDDGITVSKPWGYDSETAFWAATIPEDSWFQFPRQAGQPQLLEVWVEASGMVPLVAGTVEVLGVPVYSCGGFDSLTFKHRAAERAADCKTPIVVLHVGDHDPSGVSLFEAAAEDVTIMAENLGGAISFDRIAVTPEQVRRYNPPTAPPKSTDKRSAWQGGATVQAEALPPDILAREIRQAAERRLDMTVYRALLEREAQTREHIDAKMRQLRELTADW